jgi:hypothetical protein
MTCTSRRVLLRSNPTCNMRTGPHSATPAGSHTASVIRGEARVFMASSDTAATAPSRRLASPPIVRNWSANCPSPPSAPHGITAGQQPTPQRSNAANHPSTFPSVQTDSSVVRRRHPIVRSEVSDGRRVCAAVRYPGGADRGPLSIRIRGGFRCRESGVCLHPPARSRPRA